MVELKIHSDRLAGGLQAVRQFPFSVGRAAGSNLRLEDAGIWDQHLRLDFDPAQGFIATVLGEAHASINGWPIQSAILRNGDTIELGAVKLQFWLAAAQQSPLAFTKAFIWLALAVVIVSQALLLLWLS